MVLNTVLAVLVMASCGTNKGSVLLVNQAKEPIVRVLVMVCGQTLELKDIQPSKSARGSYTVKSDGHYDIRVEFQSGKKLQKEMGYVTNGFDFQHKFVVTDNDIEMRNSKATLQ